MPSSPESLEKLVRASFSDAAHLSIKDLSDGCGSKFFLLVVSDAFDKVKLLARHRMVHAAIAAEMDGIHAVELKTWTVAQWEKKKAAARAEEGAAACGMNPEQLADYAARQARFGLASLEAVSAAAAKEGVVWLDVRSEAEVAASPLPGSKANSLHCPVTMGDTSQLAARAGDLLPADKGVFIICFCAMGGRVMGAKRLLEGLGFTAVLNGGGLKDLVAAGVV